jgi:hypothetical protein
LRLLNLFFPILLALTGCNIDGELAECPYNVRLEYWYTSDGYDNLLPSYVYTLHEYLFDSEGILRERALRAVKSGIYTKMSLQPGDYTLVTWGNRDTVSLAAPLQIGKTKLSEIQLYTEKEGNTEPLYYSCHAFTVGKVGVTRERVDLLHCHLKLGVTVRWEATPPPNTGDFRMTLSGICPAYLFTPEYTLNSLAGKVINIPHRPQPPAYTTRQTESKMNISREVEGTFYTYRLHNQDHPVFCLWSGNTALMREIDLYRYFRTMQIDLDRNYRQEFNLLMVVDADGNVKVSSLLTGDWAEGGTIGTGDS